jgi:signal peptidase II
MLKYLAASVITAAAVLVADQITKWLARSYLPSFPDQSISVAGDFVRLTFVMNRGAAFGVLQNQNALFVVVSGVVIAVIIGSYRYSPVRSPLLNLALGLQLGGAVGNLMDRLRLGYVVDFIDVGAWPVFNVADSAIVIGVGILAFHLLRTPKAVPPVVQAEPGPAE